MGYFLSAGLMRAIGRSNWQNCIERIPCENADQVRDEVS
jgi:hypothetical protein